MSALQSRIAAFESLAGGATSHDKLNVEDDDSDSAKTPSASLLIDAPLSAATAAALQPPVVLTPPPPKPSPSPSPPNLGRKTSLIDLDDDWMFEPEEKKKSNGLLINLDSSSPPKSRPTPPSPSKKPPLPPRKPSYTSLKSVGSSSSLRSSSSSANAPQAFLYPPRPRPDGGQPLTVNTMQLLNHNNGGNSKHTQASSISSFHSVSLSSDTGSTDVSTPGSISDFIATYPVDSTESLTESFEDVSATSLSPATEHRIHSEFENARAKAANRSSTQTVTLPSAMLSPLAPAPPKLPQRPSPPGSSRSSIKSPPPLPSRSLSQRTATAGGSGSSTPRSTPASPISAPLPSSMIPTTYAVRRAPPPPPSRASYASDRSSVHSAFSTSSSGHSHNSRVLAFNQPNGSLNALAAATRTKRPTPVPLAARRRYEKVFRANVVQRRAALAEQQARRKKEEEQRRENGFLNPDSMASPGRARRAAGWRGLSVDLITGDADSVAEQLNSAEPKSKDKGKARQENSDSESEEEEDLVKVRSKLFKQREGSGSGNEEIVGPDERLDGSVVKLVWKRSGLEKRRLAEIWNECDPTQSGSLDMDSFVKGMWRIDEELRRAQSQLLKSATSPVMRNGSANSSRTSLSSMPSSKHSSYASTASGRQGVSTPTSLSRQSSIASQRSVQTTSGSRNAAYQKLTGAGGTSTPPPPSAFNQYGGNGQASGYRPGGSGGYTGSSSFNGNASYGSGYSVYGGSERGGTRSNGGGATLNVRNFIDKGSAAIGPLAATVPSAMRNLLRGS